MLATVLALTMVITNIQDLANDPEIRKTYITEDETDAIIAAHRTQPGEALVLESTDLRVDRILENLGPQWSVIQTESKTVILRKNDEQTLKRLIRSKARGNAESTPSESKP